LKQIILVAGVDYSGMFKGKGVDFRIFCDNRMKRILAGNRSKQDMTFQIFDFRRGEVITQETTYPGGKKTDKITKLTPSPFKVISRANYDVTVSGGETHAIFKERQNDTMSIIDIYTAVQKIGVIAPNTLTELSFFSHSWMGGPIMVNSYDDGILHIYLPLVSTPFSLTLPGGMRDPDDRDPRESKDFIPPTMDASKLDNFKKAFDTNGHIWIWGCSFPRLVHEILYKIEKHPKYKESGLGDEEVFKITNFNTAQADLLETVLLNARALGAPFPDKKNIEIKFKFLKYFFCLITEASYAHIIAKNANVKTIAGVMGTFSDYDKGPLPLMSVNKGFSEHFTFYKNYLGFEFDPEGRKYGVYKPSFACTTPTP
jgi:hypothetical protein